MIKLTTATLEDLDEIILLSNEAYLPYLNFLSRKPRVLRMTRKDWEKLQKNNQVHVYKEEDELIVVVTLKESHWNKEDLDLSRLAVSPHFQKKGIGSAIIDWAEDEANSQNKNINLATYSKNKRLCDFYSKRGYSIVKRFTHNNEEIVVFKKTLH